MKNTELWIGNLHSPQLCLKLVEWIIMIKLLGFLGIWVPKIKVLDKEVVFPSN